MARCNKIVLATILTIGGLARAQERPDARGPQVAPPVEDLVAEALLRSPSVAALRARVTAARAAVAPSGALPDPMLEVMYQNVGAPWDPMRQMTMGQVQWTQSLPWPGRLAARRAVAEAEVDERAAEAEDMRRAVVAEVRMAYAGLYRVDRELESLDDAAEMLGLLSATAATRYSSGQGEQEAIIKAQVEASRLEERRLDLQARRAALVAALNGLLDRPAGSSLGRVEALPATEVDGASVLALALARSTEVRMRAAAVRAAERRLEAARLEARPGFLVGAGAGSTLAPEAVVSLRVGIELPIYNRQKAAPMVAQAQAELEAAAADLRSAEARVRAEVDLLVAEWERDQAQVVRFREATVPGTAVAMDAARASYLAGRGDFSTVIEDFRMWLDARVGLAGREADRYATWARIERLTSPAAGPGGAHDAGGE